MKLGVFLRSGIVATAWWLTLGSMVLTDRWLKAAAHDQLAGLGKCIDSMPALGSRNCENLWPTPQIGDYWGMAIIFTVGTAIEGWIIGLLAYWSVRWILTGRANRQQN